MTEFIAALIGALVGGAISFMLQRQSFADQERIRASARERDLFDAEEARRQREVILGFSILRKFARAHTSMKDFYDHLHEGMAHSLRTQMDFSVAVKAFSSDPEKLTFTLDEFILLKALKNDSILNKVMDLPYVHEMYVENMAVVRSLRLELNSLLDDAEVDSSGRAHTVYKGSGAAKAKVIAYQMRQILFHLYGRSFYDYPMLHNVFVDVQEALHNRIGKAEMGFAWQIERVFQPPEPPGRHAQPRQPI